MQKKEYTIAVIGLWHLGEIYANGLASLGHTVIGIDSDKAMIAALREGVPPLAEPGLAELMKKNAQAKRISYSSDIADVKNADITWITFDTEVNDRDESDLSIISIRATIKKAIPYLKNDALLVVSSQLPAGTSEAIQKMIRKARPKLSFHYSYSPENLRLGEALNCFLTPERIVVGASDDEAFSRMQNIFRKVSTEFVRMSPTSAEMAKHALNAFLATSISFINDIADVSEQVGADVADVIAALRSDPRIGRRAALGAGMGFSGGTLGRDLVSLSRIADEHHISLPVITAAFKKNLLRPALLIARLEKIIGSVKGKRVVIYGLAYKAGTSTLRRSRSLEVARLLLKKGAFVVLSDFHVPLATIPHYKESVVIEDAYEAAKQADALVFITPWSDFQDLDFLLLKKAARSACIVLDSGNFLRGREAVVKKAGFRYYGIGR